MRDQPDAETSTWQHTKLTRDIHAPGGIQTRNRSKRRPQTHAVDGSATGIDVYFNRHGIYFYGCTFYVLVN
jgi:hypothetical protein